MTACNCLAHFTTAYEHPCNLPEGGREQFHHMLRWAGLESLEVVERVRSHRSGHSRTGPQRRQQGLSLGDSSSVDGLGLSLDGLDHGGQDVRQGGRHRQRAVRTGLDVACVHDDLERDTPGESFTQDVDEHFGLALGREVQERVALEQTGLVLEPDDGLGWAGVEPAGECCAHK